MNFLPPLTNSAKKIIFINVAIFLPLQFCYHILGSKWIQDTFTLTINVWETGKYWQFFTHFFIHIELWVLFLEMLLIYFLSAPLEQMWGEKNFLIFYFSCGVISGIISVLSLNLFFIVNEQGTTNVPPIYNSFAVCYATIAAFSLLYKERVITLLLFFVLPISLKGKYILYLSIGYLILTNMQTSIERILFGLSGVITGILFLNFLTPYLFKGNHSRVGSFESFKQKIDSFFTSIKKNKKSNRNSFSTKTQSQKQEKLNIHEMSTLVAESKIDELLEKISKKGYTSLSQQERDFLLEASNKYKHKFPK